jgi:hypothetical protein
MFLSSEKPATVLIEKPANQKAFLSSFIHQSFFVFSSSRRCGNSGKA